VPANGRYEWTGERYGEDLEVLFQTRRGHRAYIRNMDVDVCCCSKSTQQVPVTQSTFSLSVSNDCNKWPK